VGNICSRSTCRCGSVAGPGEGKYHVLITTVKALGPNEFQPDQILAEVNGVPEPLDANPDFHKVHINLGGVTLVEGQTYAFVIDPIVARDGVDDSTHMGLSSSDLPGYFAFSSPTTGNRAADFNANWAEQLGQDLDFTATFSQAGNTIVGTKKGNLIDAANAPNGQPFATPFDDLILGNKGKDTAFGGDGFDTLDGGKGNDKLYGGNDGDRLLGGKGHDKLYGGAGADSLVFDFKLSKKSAAKHFDKIGDFNAAEDTIYLDRGHFTALAPGDLPDTDTHVTLKNGKLFYDGVKFAIFLAGAPVDVDDIHFVVYG
jgi:RTX calcium-binding nonapeptide repeat (4 copies)